MKCPNCGEEMALQDTVWTCGGCGCGMPAKDCRACPNCGDKMTLRRNALGGSEKWICTYCEFEMPFNGLPADDESAESKTSVLHCRFCGAPLDKRPDFCYECGAEQNGAYVDEEPQSAACPNCGNVLVIHDEQYGQVEMCLKCGYARHLDPNDPSEDAKRSDNRCRQCGAELVNNENFCPKCGKSVTQQTVRRSSRVGGIIMAIIGAIAAIVGVVFLISSNQSTPNYSGYDVGGNGYNTAGAAGIEPDYWYHYNAIPYLNVQNCTIENASAGSSHVIVTYHPVCRSCHTEFKTLEIAAPEYGHDVIKNYICPNCYATTRVWLKLSN